MKKNLLNEGVTVEFVKNGGLEDGLLLVKDVYTAKVEVIDAEDANLKVQLDVPYKDIKAIL